MISLRRCIAPLALAAFIAGCSDSATAPSSTLEPAARPSAALVPATNPLANIPILSAAGALLGNLSITNLSVVNGTLVGSGSFTNAATGLVTTVTNLPLSLLASGPGNSCQILTLHIGAVDLNLLGLTVNLAPVDLVIAAQPGPGNLLGNLLCAVAHLLDGPGALAGLLNILGQVNAILAGL